MTIVHSQAALTQLLFFFCLAGFLVPLLVKHKINRTVGFLTAGFIFGPFVMGSLAESFPLLSYITASNSQIVEDLAELGIMFMLFTIGLELSLKKLWSLRYWVFVAGSLQLILTAITFYILLDSFSIAKEMSLILAISFSFSSTAIVSQYLISKNELGSEKGRIIISVLLFQDLAVIPTLLLTNFLGTSQASGIELLSPLLTVLATSIFAMVVLYFIGRLVVNPLLKISSAQSDSLDSFFAIILFLFFGALGLFHAFGISLALGALLVGVLLADTEFKHAAGVLIDPFRGLLLGVFFLSIGFKINPSLFVDEASIIAQCILLIFFIKTLLLTIIFLLSKLKFKKSLIYSALLAQGGEFAFVVITTASSFSILNNHYTELSIIIAALSMFLALPYYQLMLLVANTFLPEEREKIDSSFDPKHIPEEINHHVVIAGYGRVGSMIGEILREQNIPFIGLDKNVEKLKNYKNDTSMVYYGNPSSPGILERLNLNNAVVVILTMDNPDSTLITLRFIRKHYPDVPIISRSRDHEDTQKLIAAGSDDVIPEAIEVGLHFVELILERVGHVPSTISARINQYRDKYNSC